MMALLRRMGPIVAFAIVTLTFLDELWFCLEQEGANTFILLSLIVGVKVQDVFVRNVLVLIEEFHLLVFLPLLINSPMVCAP